MLWGSWRAARRPGAAGQGLVGAVFLLPRSLLAVSLPRKHSVAPPTPRFAYDHIASFGVYLTRCSRAKMYIPGSPSAFLCRVKGHTQYVVRAEEGEPGNVIFPPFLVCISSIPGVFLFPPFLVCISSYSQGFFLGTLFEL